jgi:hypothetical protein
VRLLHDNRDGSLQRFDELLAALTGANLEALDQAVGDWLLAPGRIMLRDHYSIPSGYQPRWSDTRSQRGYEGDEYAVVKLADSGDIVTIPVGPLGEFEAEVQVRFMPPTRGAVVNLEFAMPGKGNYYRYQVHPADRAFALEHWLDRQRHTVLDWTLTTAIQGDTASNRLGLRVTRSEIVLRANGHELTRLPVDPGEPSTDAGLLTITVGHREYGWAEARFSGLVVTNAR